MKVQLLAPRYWPTWLGLGLLRLVALLPFAALVRLGGITGRALRRLPTGYVRTARRNIELCLPELSAAERERLLDRHFVNLGISLFEIPYAWWLSPARLEKIVHFEGVEHLRAALARGRGVILLTAHFCSLELSARSLHGLKAGRLAVVYRPTKNPVVSYALARFRGNFDTLPIRRDDVRGLVAALKRNEMVWYAPDQSYRKKGAEMVPMFGIPAATNTATSRLARVTGAAVLPYFLWRLPGSGGYRGVIGPPLEDFPGACPIEDAARFNRLIEAQVRRVPEQYLWIHRRFKGLTSDYPDYYGRQAPRRA